MTNTRKQKRTRWLIGMLDHLANGKSERAKQLLAADRRLEKRKRKQFNKGNNS